MINEFVSMYKCNPCNTCEYRLDNGFIRPFCLSCKWMYNESGEAFKHKSDLYVKEEHHENELKPCPFCGGEAEIIENEYECVDVSCKSMGCRGFTDYLQYGSREEAAEAWNRRWNDDQA